MGSLKITLGELEALIQEGLAEIGDVGRREWERIRIEPEKRLSRHSDVAEAQGFWVVAMLDDQAVWYNDIEDGFEATPFNPDGSVQYTAGALTFQELLLCLPGVQFAEQWLDTPASTDVPEELRGGGTIVRRQTTYWEFQSLTGNLWRVHFRGVAERKFVEPGFQQMKLHKKHPLLANTTEPWTELYISEPLPDPEPALLKMAERVRLATDGWRSLDEYLNPYLASGNSHGLLLRGPASLAKMCADVLGESRVSLVSLPASTTRLEVLAMDRNAILSEAFRFEHHRA